MDDPIIRVEGLTAAYEGQVVLQDVSFTVMPGEIFGILGGSGCGKSTLLKHLIGLYEPVAGTIILAGQELGKTRGEARLKLQQKMGVLYQSGALFGSMSVMENVRLPLEEFTALDAEAVELIAQMKLKLVGLTGVGDLMPAALSGGMQKRVALARAMALDPMILFLDEPLAGLDPVTSTELDQLLLQISRSLGITLVMVTHELVSIDAIANRVILLDKEARGIIAAGTPAALRDHNERPEVHRFFHRETAATARSNAPETPSAKTAAWR